MLQVVVLTNATLEESKRVDEICRAASPAIAFIRAETRGVFASVFNDFGPSFTVFDTDGRGIEAGWSDAELWLCLVQGGLRGGSSQQRQGGPTLRGQSGSCSRGTASHQVALLLCAAAHH